jgi:hypothetical protein
MPHAAIRFARIILVVGLWPPCALLAPTPAHAQTRADSADAAPLAPPVEPKNDYENRLYLGMWTMHLHEPVLTLRNNWTVGFTTHGYFGATFVNSYGNRAFTGGIQRTIAATAPRAVTASFGIRLGAITGYDGRLMRLARDTPVLPLVQPYARIDVTRFGIEVSYTWVVVSVGLSYRL